MIIRRIAVLFSLVLIFSIPWENAITLGGLGTLARAAGIFAAATWLGSILVTGKIRRLHPFHFLVFLFTLWNILSLYWTADARETNVRIISYIQLALLAWILWDLFTTSKTLTNAMQAYIFGGYAVIGATIYNYLTSQGISTYAENRFAGAGMDANDLALILILGMPVAWYLAGSLKAGIPGQILRMVDYAYIPCALFAAILTASRTALFAIVPVGIYILGTANQLKPFVRILIVVVLIGVLFGLQLFIPQATFERLSTIPSSITTGDLGGRVPLWRASIREFFEHPWIGVGSGALASPFQLGTYAHNTFLSILAELGVVGFIIFGVLLAVVLREAIFQPKGLSRLWLAVLAVWVIGVFTLSWEFRKPTWLFLSLIVISSNLLDLSGEPIRRSSVAPFLEGSVQPATLDTSGQPHIAKP